MRSFDRIGRCDGRDDVSFRRVVGSHWLVDDPVLRTRGPNVRERHSKDRVRDELEPQHVWSFRKRRSPRRHGGADLLERGSLDRDGGSPFPVGQSVEIAPRPANRVNARRLPVDGSVEREPDSVERVMDSSVRAVRPIERTTLAEMPVDVPERRAHLPVRRVVVSLERADGPEIPVRDPVDPVTRSGIRVIVKVISACLPVVPGKEIEPPGRQMRRGPPGGSGAHWLVR